MVPPIETSEEISTTKELVITKYHVLLLLLVITIHQFSRHRSKKTRCRQSQPYVTAPPTQRFLRTYRKGPGKDEVARQFIRETIAFSVKNSSDGRTISRFQK